MEKFSFDGFCLAHLKMNSILREKRLVLGLTQQQVAEKSKINYRQYQKFESGERNIMTASFQLTCRVLKALDMDIEKFYNGDYVFGEPIAETPNGLIYKRTGRRFNKEVEE